MSGWWVRCAQLSFLCLKRRLDDWTVEDVVRWSMTTTLSPDVELTRVSLILQLLPVTSCYTCDGTWPALKCALNIWLTPSSISKCQGLCRVCRVFILTLIAESFLTMS